MLTFDLCVIVLTGSYVDLRVLSEVRARHGHRRAVGRNSRRVGAVPDCLPYPCRSNAVHHGAIERCVITAWLDW